MSPHDYVKVLFRQEGEEGDTLVESMWCVSLGEGNFRVGIIPFEVYLCAVDDIIYALDEQGVYRYVRHVEASGNSVLRILYPEGFDVDRFVSYVKDLGMDVEQAGDTRLLALHAPAERSIHALLTYLAFEEEQGHLWYEEACISEFHQKQQML